MWRKITMMAGMLLFGTSAADQTYYLIHGNGGEQVLPVIKCKGFKTLEEYSQSKLRESGYTRKSRYKPNIVRNGNGEVVSSWYNHFGPVTSKATARAFDKARRARRFHRRDPVVIECK